MTTTPKEKTAKEWLEHLPEPLRTEALEACEKFPLLPDKECSFDACISIAIDWDNARDTNWGDISNKLVSGQILPVEPEQSKQQEPKQMSDTEGTEIEKLSKAFNKHAETQEKRLQLMVDLYDKLQGKLEALQKELDTSCPKQIEDKQPDNEDLVVKPQYTDEKSFVMYPKNDLERFKSFLETPLTEETKKNLDAAYERIKATKYEGLTAMDYLLQFGGPDFPNALNENLSAPVKLPVTVEEVWELEKGMRGKDSLFISGNEITKSTFDGEELFDEYRHESTAKFVDAVRKLTKIQEAQNEMCERGEFVCVVFIDESGSISVNHHYSKPMYGQIYFHSEQGLKDCIAANQQLWKDYLRIS